VGKGQSFEKGDHSLRRIFEDIASNFRKSMRNSQTEFSNFFIEAKFLLIPHDLPQHFAAIFQSFPHIFRQAGRYKGFSKFITPIAKQNEPYFLQISHFFLKDQLFDIPKRIDQIGSTGVLRAKQFVLRPIIIEITGSLNKSGSEGVQE
jgi:hypothetical protein